MTGRLCCGLSDRNSSSGSSASSAARLTSISRAVFTIAKYGASGTSASDRLYWPGSATMFFSACSFGT
jgi:hypothetical protein